MKWCKRRLHSERSGAGRHQRVAPAEQTTGWTGGYDSILRLDIPFRLPFRYIIYKEALREEVVSPPDLLSRLVSLGLEGVEITEEEFFYAEDLAENYVKLSGYDRIALAIAKVRKICLLTGDAALRKAAIKEGVEVFGTIRVLDMLHESGKINNDDYLYCLENLKKHPERRLPQEELERRIIATQRELKK